MDKSTMKIKFSNLLHYDANKLLPTQMEVDELMEEIKELWGDPTSELFDGNYRIFENPIYEPLNMSLSELVENKADLFDDISFGEPEYFSDLESVEAKLTFCNAGFKISENSSGSNASKTL